MTNRVTVSADGPLRIEGDVEIQDADGTTLAHGGRFVLCRCGHAATPPFCDGSHARALWREAGFVRAGRPGRAAEPPPRGRLVVEVVCDGPLVLRGSFDLIGVEGRLAFRDGKGALCRCGRSAQGALCDGAHARPGCADGRPEADRQT